MTRQRAERAGLSIEVESQGPSEFTRDEFGNAWVWGARVHLDGKLVTGGIFFELDPDDALNAARTWLFRNRVAILANGETKRHKP